MLRRLRLVPALLALCAVPALALETQIPFDAAGRVTLVNARLARHLALGFASRPGLQEARLFAGDDSTRVLELTRTEGGQLQRERIVLSPAAFDSLRTDFAQRWAEHGPLGERPSTDGRTRLVTGYVLLGLGFYGWALPASLDTPSGEAVVGTYLLTAGVCGALPLLLTSGGVSANEASMSLYGATRGIAHGIVLRDVFSSRNDDLDDNVLLGLAMGTSIAEGVGGFALARATRWDDGVVQSVQNGGDYAFAWGLLVSDMAGGDWNHGTAALTLGMTAAGLAGGAALGHNRAYTFGDAQAMRSAGYLGTAWGLAFADATQPDRFGDSRRYSAGALFGSIAGLAIGDRLVAGRDFSPGESAVLHLGAAAGALTALGAVALFQPRGDQGSAAYWFGGAAGGTLGYAIAYVGASPRATARAAGRTGWRLELAPEGLLALRSARADASAPPLLRLSARF